MRRHALSFLLGAVSGALGGMMGVGGGIVLVPLLTHVLREGQHEAQGTSLAFILVIALVASASYYTFERLDVTLALVLAAGAVPGVILGSRLAAATPGHRLRAGFGIVLIATAVRLLAAPPQGSMGTGEWPALANALVGLAVGLLGGLLVVAPAGPPRGGPRGGGGGTFLVPVLVLGQNIDQHTAQGVSLLMIVPVGVVGMVIYARGGRLTTQGLPFLLAGGAAGAFAGAYLAHRIQAPVLTRLFALLLLAMAAQMIFRRPRGNVAASAATSGGDP
jgi:uncharacterized membrane protein YfcA